MAIHLLYCRRRRGCASLPETCSHTELDKKNFIRVAPHLLKKNSYLCNIIVAKAPKGEQWEVARQLVGRFSFFCVRAYSHAKKDPGNVTFGVFSCTVSCTFFLIAWISSEIAERTRFELVVGLLLRQFSKLVVSATHPPLLWGFTAAKVKRFFEISKFFRINIWKLCGVVRKSLSLCSEVTKRV